MAWRGIANGCSAVSSGINHITGDERPEPLIGHKFPVQEVTIAVEPDIPDDIPGSLLGAHFDVDTIGVAAIPFDVRVKAPPRVLVIS